MCLPYAGGSASTYRSWSDVLGPSIDVCAVELSGRGTRFAERPVDRTDELLEEVTNAVRSLRGGPVALFGHSFGARLAFATARAVGERDVAHVFVSGAGAADLPRKGGTVTGPLSDAELRQELIELGGTPAAVLDDPELMALVAPMLRADFALAADLVTRLEPPLSCPVTAFAGRADTHVPLTSVERWREATSATFRMMVVDGGHFFLEAQRAIVTREIARALAPVT